MAEDVLYIGRRGPGRGDPSVVIETAGGELLGILPDFRRTGDASTIEWGYGGRGPTELARNMLLHALGEDAVCWRCRGNGYLRTRADPNAPKGYVVEPYDPGDEPEPDFRPLCDNHRGCNEGYLRMPTHAFVERFLLHLSREPETEWRLSQAEILQWLHSDGIAAL